MALLPTVEINPIGPARASVIWLHGLGADGHDFESIVPELNLSPELGIRFVFPHAPVRPITINGGLPMRAWFDILGLDRLLVEDEAGIRASALLIGELIGAELQRGIPSEKIILAGFSQGGAMALQCALRYPLRLAGALVLSAFLPLASRLQAEAHAANQNLPIFLAHGTQDPILPFSFGELSRDTLKAQGYPVEWHSYTMPHAVCPEEVRDIGVWLSSVNDGRIF